MTRQDGRPPMRSGPQPKQKIRTAHTYHYCAKCKERINPGNKYHWEYIPVLDNGKYIHNNISHCLTCKNA